MGTSARQTGFPKAFLAAGERILIELKPRKTPFLLRWTFLLFPFAFLMFFVFVGAGGNLSAIQPSLLLFGAFFGAIAVIMAVLGYLQWRATFYAITGKRIMSVTGVIGRSFVDMPHAKVQNVTLVQNFFHKWMGYGHLVFASAGAGGGAGMPQASSPTRFLSVLGNIVFLGVPDPLAARKHAQDIIEQSQQQLKEKDYRKMAETFKEVQATPMPVAQERRVVSVTERKPAKFCEFCGAAVEGVPMFCVSCGNRVN